MEMVQFSVNEHIIKLIKTNISFDKGNKHKFTFRKTINEVIEKQACSLTH